MSCTSEIVDKRRTVFIGLSALFVGCVLGVVAAAGSGLDGFVVLSTGAFAVLLAWQRGARKHWAASILLLLSAVRVYVSGGEPALLAVLTGLSWCVFVLACAQARRALVVVCAIVSAATTLVAQLTATVR